MKDLGKTLPGNPLGKQIDHFRNLQAGWGSPDAAKIDEAAIVGAKALLEAVHTRLHHLSPTDVSPLLDGGISLEFTRPERVEVDVDASGKFTVLEISHPAGVKTYVERDGLTMEEAVDALIAFERTEA